jgi:hypothetical protein
MTRRTSLFVVLSATICMAACQATFVPKPGQVVETYRPDDFECERRLGAVVGLVYNNCMESKGYQRK